MQSLWHGYIGVLSKCVSLSVLLPALAALPTFAQSYVVNGYVEEASSGERLPGAHVTVIGQRFGASTNAFGFFSVNARSGVLQLSISHVAFQSVLLDFEVTSDTTLVIAMNPRIISLDEVVVSAEEESPVDEIQMSSHRLPIEQIESLPVLLGETDILKTMQLLPGVQGGREGFSGLYVRGGRADQNLILLDGLPLYNPTHFLGLFSVFNASAVKQVELIKGGFPARYGGRLSSVASFTMKEGNLKQFAGEGTLGLMTSSFVFEGPIIRDRASFLISGRRTFLDLLTRRFQTRGQVIGGYFYDLNFKANYLVSTRDRLYVSGYMGQDVFSFEDHRGRDSTQASVNDDLDLAIAWRNRLASIRWNRLLSDRLFANLIVGITGYRIRTWTKSTAYESQEAPEEYEQTWQSSVLDYTARLELEYTASKRHYLRIGAEYISHQLTPSSQRVRLKGNELSDTLIVRSTLIPADEFSVYVEDELRWDNGTRANVGLRLSSHLGGTGLGRLAEPRLSVNVPIGVHSAVKLSWTYMKQFVHRLSAAGSTLPNDIWIPVMKGIAPQRSTQVAAGLIRRLTRYNLDISLEGYYKQMRGQMEYKAQNYAHQGTTLGWPNILDFGRGTSYGAEFLIERKQRRLNGWSSYTWARTNRVFEGIDAGNPFPDTFDRRHDVSFVAHYQVTPRSGIGITWVYGSGYPIWVPVGRFQDRSRRIENEYFDYGSINSSRVPAMHRLDLSGRFSKQTRWGFRTFTVGLYNVYNRKNPWYIYPRTGINGNIEWTQLSLLQLIPAFSYELKF